MRRRIPTAALRLSKELGYLGSLAICNVPGSSLVRESDPALMTKAGTEIGVASTKSLYHSADRAVDAGGEAGASQGPGMRLSSRISCMACRRCRTVSSRCCRRDKRIEQLAERFSDKHHALFLGRGDRYPIALEGALKLKEISYIHAEAYAAGELKHGPLALIDAEMPVIVVAPNNELLEKN